MDPAVWWEKPRSAAGSRGICAREPRPPGQDPRQEAEPGAGPAAAGIPGPPLAPPLGFSPWPQHCSWSPLPSPPSSWPLAPEWSSCALPPFGRFLEGSQSLVVRLVMRYWEPVPRGPVLWEARAEPWATWVPLLCFVLHVISWLLIFSILLVFDYAELMGLKQVYYHVLGLGEPLALKSPRALRLFSHLRHPVCVELLTVLWVVPTLGTDRLLLALLLTLYLGLAHGLDQQDLRYLRAQLQRKLHLLSRPQDGEAE
ncbi:nurim isoform X3 [Equus przewalskii]|uniref:Nurim n=1 Tax=Equus przewalskii TaxID=9798 RepID=A0ABM2FP69_EQUPR|nr:PREDICTED: nurim isoform X3 [Equus przewalskii]